MSIGRKEIAGSLLWKLLERGGVQVSQFIVSLVIARLVMPSAYGAVALIMIFISIAAVFVQSGLNTALIQKKDADNSDVSAVLLYSMCIATLLYIALFFSAPFIENFFNIPNLTQLLRVLSLTMFPGAFNSIQLAIFSKRMEFKKQCVAGVISSVLSGTLGIIMAFKGFEAWAIVAQQLSYQTLICLILCGVMKTQLTLRISLKQTKGLLSYGIKLMGARLIDTLYHNLESFIIGKVFSPTALAYCNKGKQFPLTLIDNIDGSVQSVMLPAYSARQDDITGVKQMLRKAISLSSYVVFPSMTLLATAASPMIRILLGENWIGSIPYMVLFCFIAMLFPLQTANLQAINAIGRSDIYLKLMTWKRSIGTVLLIISVIIWRSPFAVVIAALLVEFIGVAINIPSNIALFGYSLAEMLADTLPNLLVAIFMGLACFLLLYVIKNSFALLALQLLAGPTIYIALSIIVKNQNFQYIKSLVLSKISKRQA